MLRIEVIDNARAELGEGPLWDVAEQRLYWIDSLGAKVHSCNATGGERRTWSVPEHIGSLALREGGGAIVSLRDGFYTLDFGTGACCKLVDPDPGKPRIRMNDGKVDRQGRFVAGTWTMRRAIRSAASFDLIRAASVAALDSGIVCSNGPCWSPDGRTFYFADTATREIWAYDYDRHRRGHQPPHLLLLPGRSASKGCPTVPRSMLMASSGACRSMRESWCASRRMDGSTDGWDCRSKARRVRISAAPTSISPM